MYNYFLSRITFDKYDYLHLEKYNKCYLDDIERFSSEPQVHIYIMYKQWKFNISFLIRTFYLLNNQI